MKNLLRPVSRWVDAWLSEPESNAAGRLGLYRILYALFYLWYMTFGIPANLSGLPASYRRRVLLIDWLPADPSPFFFELLTTLLITSLIFLLFGLGTHLVTALVLFSGAIIEAFYVSTDFEHSTILLTAFIPGFMLISGSWGSTYSVDAWLRRRLGNPPIDTEATSVPFVLPIRALLALLAALFFTSGIAKILPGAVWNSHPHLMANLVLTRNIEAATLGFPLNPAADLLVVSPVLDQALRVFVTVFEISFPLVLFHDRVRSLYLSLALIFHSVNAIWLLVTFTPVLVVYLLFVDLEAGRRYLWPGWVSFSRRAPPFVPICLISIIALVVGILWNRHGTLQPLFNLGGLIDSRTLWYPILPVAVIWWVRSVMGLVRGGIGTPSPNPS